MSFPEVTGQNLDGREYQFPADFEGELNLVVVAFRQSHAPVAESWGELALELAEEYPGIELYEFPVLGRAFVPARRFIDAGMRAGISDPSARERTITLYLNKPPFRRALDIEGEEEVHAFLVDPTGEPVWRGTGAPTPALTEEVRSVLDEHLDG